MWTPRIVPTLGAAALVLTTVAGCTGDSAGRGASAPPPIATATRTVASAAPPTGSGVPASTPASAAASPSGPGLCTPTVMTFAVGQPDGAAGTSLVTVTATNGSAAPCVTTGFAGVAFLDAAGKQFLQADRDPTVQSTTLTVPPGGTISARLAVGDVGAGGGTCAASTAILLTLPDNTDSTRLDLPEASACDAQVQAFVEGDGR